MKINHISISREQCFSECSQKYKFRYHLETVSPEPTPIYFTFGKIVHRIIEEYTRAKGTIAIDKLTKDLFSGKMDLEPGKKCPELNVEYKNKLVRHLRNFMRLTERIGLDGEVEWQFKMDMDGNGRCMTGFIDRLIKKDGKYVCLDYKTTKPSSWRKDSRTITKDLQLQCYCYVVMKEFGAKAQDIEAALIFLDDYKIVPVRFSEQTLLKVPERLLQVYKEIEEMPPEKAYGNVGRHCNFCDYKSICPYYFQ